MCIPYPKFHRSQVHMPFLFVCLNTNKDSLGCYKSLGITVSLNSVCVCVCVQLEDGKTAATGANFLLCHG